MNYRPPILIVLALTLFTSTSVASDNRFYSKLWGRAGESWNPESRLPDFSFAGYHRGERSVPQRTGTQSVKTFGAIGDGVADDTAAFQKAIDASNGRVLFIPKGRYKITDILSIRVSKTILRGEGSGQSILFFPTPLNEIKPNWGATTSGRRTSNYSWSGGFIHVQGKSLPNVLSSVTSPAKRGQQTLIVSNHEAFKSGDEIRVIMNDTPENSLARHLYSNDPGPISNLKGRLSESFACRVTRVDAKVKAIEFDRPLGIDIELKWNPRIVSAKCSVEEAGLEKLGFEFPNTPYRGHFTEVGYNAIAMSGVRNCWIDDIRIHNADSGIFVSGSNVSLRGITITSDREAERSRQGTGHHGISLGGQDNFLTDFDFRTRFMHDITVTRGSVGNVVSSGRGIDLALDHHRYGPHANLFTDIDLGVGSRMFQSGGGAQRGRHSGAYETFWNIRSERPQIWPAEWGPSQMNFIGVRSDMSSVTNPKGRWFEVVTADKELTPANLHLAQLKRRLAAQE